MRAVLLSASLILGLAACKPSAPEAAPVEAEPPATAGAAGETSAQAAPVADVPVADAPASTPAAAPPLVTHHYQCGDYTVKATFSTGEAATVVVGGRPMTLPKVPSDVGSRYADGAGNEIRTEGDTEAWLTLAGEGLVTCVGQAVENTAVMPTAPEYPLAREACLDTVAKEANSDRATLRITDVVRAEAGVGVTIVVPGLDAPWSCLSSEAGTVEGAAYMGPDGAP
jgi:membrane-bound inhibitor of C-type lysozyme